MKPPPGPPTRLLLASGSPWKLAILRRLGLPVAAVPHGVDETAFSFAGDPEGAVAALAAAKALGPKAPPETLVIGLDQVGRIGDRIFGKAETAAEALARLRLLSGADHELLCGYALAREGRVLTQGVEVVRLWMRALTADALERYVATGEWRGSAGCYRIEGVGRQLFTRIEGDFYTVQGVPVPSLLEALRAAAAPGLL